MSRFPSLSFCEFVLLWVPLSVAPAFASSNLSEIPIEGYRPLVGFGLTDEFKEENEDIFFFFSETSSAPGGTALGAGGTQHFDLALVDTGAQASVMTYQASLDFDLEGAGFKGTEIQVIGGATGFLDALIEDPLGIYAAGLSHRITEDSLTIEPTAMRGQTSVSLVTAPPEFSLPNSVIGLPFLSQYTTIIRYDQPQVFTLDGQTIRSPQIDFLPLGSGADQGITMRAPLELIPGSAFLQPPIYVFNLNNIFDEVPLTENPAAPTVVGGALFLNVNAADGDHLLENVNLLWDTGANATVVSELTAVRLGFDPIIDEPDFVVEAIGTAGSIGDVPGFFADSLTVNTVGGSFSLSNVPLVVFDVTDPGDPGNIIEGVIGTNLFRGHNLVIDPNPSVGGGGVGPSLYISESVLESHGWNTTAASGEWDSDGNWDGEGVPNELWIADVANETGTPQNAIVDTDTLVNEVFISGSVGATMSVVVEEGATLSTFGRVQVEEHGMMTLNHGDVSAQNMRIRSGQLDGVGGVEADLVENFSGSVAPGEGIGSLEIRGKFAQRDSGRLEIDIGGTQADTQYDQLTISLTASLGGTLDVSFVDSFQPRSGDEFQILTADDGMIGTFDTEILPTLLPGLFWDVDYGLSTLSLHVMGNLYGDMDCDGDVDFDDIGFFVLGIEDPQGYESVVGVPPTLKGDTDSDGDLDFDDILGFVAAIAAYRSGVQAVPEPSSILLFGVALGCVLAIVGRGQRTERSKRTKRTERTERTLPLLSGRA